MKNILLLFSFCLMISFVACNPGTKVEEPKSGINSNASDDQSSDVNLSITGDENKLTEDKILNAENIDKLADLISNKEKYSNKIVKVSGECIKVNQNIMGRNWVHLTDASLEAFDLTITTKEAVILGSVVSFVGIITLNKDFGGGYVYDIIMEDAVLK